MSDNDRASPFPCAGRGPVLEDTILSGPMASDPEPPIAAPADAAPCGPGPLPAQGQGEACDRGQTPANPARGEAALIVAGEPWKLRPSFTALVAAEEELGSLFALVDRAAGGGLKLAELVALFWHCCEAQQGRRPAREQIGEAVTAQGLANVTPALRQLLEAVLKGG